MRFVLAATIVLASCLAGQLDPADESIIEQASTIPETVCDYALCQPGWLGDYLCSTEECSGPGMCKQMNCDNCGGRCIALRATPVVPDP